MVRLLFAALLLMLSTSAFATVNTNLNGYGQFWTADNYYYFNGGISIVKPEIYANGDFRRLEHEHMNAIQFCQALGYYGQPTWSTSRSVSKHDRWTWRGFWAPSYGRHYISPLNCFY